MNDFFMPIILNNNSPPNYDLIDEDKSVSDQIPSNIRLGKKEIVSSSYESISEDQQLHENKKNSQEQHPDLHNITNGTIS